MKIIITESQIKKIIEEEKKELLNENLSLVGWILALSLGGWALPKVWALYQKYKKGRMSRKQFKTATKKLKKKEETLYQEKQPERKPEYSTNNYDQYYAGGTQKENIAIGDPQAAVLAGKSRKLDVVGSKGGESNLWNYGADVNWLKSALKKFPVSPNVRNVVICIGTNNTFSQSEDISGLFSLLFSRFPNASFHTVQGSWGKGSNVEVELKNVERYYNKFKSYSNIVGSVGDISNLKLHPHNPKIKSYGEIAAEVDRLL